MKVISDRVSILEKDDVFSLVILPSRDAKKLWMIFGWLMAWTVCGFIVLANYPRMTDPNAKLFIIVYLSFWAYFEYKIIKVYSWKKFGKEKLWIKGGKLFYQQEVSGKGKIKEFDLELVHDLNYIELSHASFADSFNQSFWVKGGERLEFHCQSRFVRFGLQLSDEEAREILRKLKSRLPNN